MRKRLQDTRGWLSFAVFNPLNWLVVRARFRRLEVAGIENVPCEGPFIVVSNHICRWDGLVLHELIGRPCNWMVSPNELTGLQGAVLRSMGCFPADCRYDLVGFVRAQAASGHGIVIFPEGNVFADGATHPFKNGAARLALSCAAAGIALPVVPVAIHYPEEEPASVRVSFGEPVELLPYLEEFAGQSNMGVRSLTVRLYREVCHLRHNLGVSADNLVLFTGRPVKRWVPREPGAKAGRPASIWVNHGGSKPVQHKEPLGAGAVCRG
ncbi:MAG TPA: lysophospholipid acyltransferase family protein [Candidatus Obscuribacterales bacterium]